MGKDQRHFIAGKMNKSASERLVPNGSYIDAMNIRVTSSGESDDGGAENLPGNKKLTNIVYQNVELSSNAVCIGSIADESNETIYWFVHDPSFTLGVPGKLDLILSYNTSSNKLKYHVVSIDDGSGDKTTLNFDAQYLITGLNIIDEFLFFTDNLNNPRVINTKKTYPAPLGNVDRIVEEDICVIRKPPFDPPSVDGIIDPNSKNYLNERFVSFAVRYRYADNQYSAVSPFTNPVFANSGFELDPSTMRNVGMSNIYSSALITYNTGSSFVKGIDLLFKDSDSNVIKVIDRIDKEKNGLLDNTDYEYVFDGNKVFTILPDYEILRLYDNVPKLAQAQTLIGSRLAYGNYVEGYNIADETKLTFYTELQSSSPVNIPISATTYNGSYGWGIGGSVSVNDSIIRLNLGNFELNKGSIIFVEFTLSHGDWVVGSLSNTVSGIPVEFSIELQKDYASVYQLSISNEFVEAIGKASNIQLALNSCSGSTITDIVNCSLPATLFNSSNSINYQKYNNGIDNAGEPIKIISSAGDDYIDLQIPAIQWVSDISSPGTSYAIEAFTVGALNASFFKRGSSESLHSNRNYSVGVSYVDEYGRLSVPLVSQFNSIYIPPSASVTKNQLRVTIPTTQKPPSWAVGYRFFVKPAENNYDCIYTNYAYRNPIDSTVWVLLQGENAQKVNTGDRLIVKKDSGGALRSLVYADVLEKKVQEADFLPIKTSSNTQVPIPSGVYMQLRTENYSIKTIDSADVYNPGTISHVSKGHREFSSLVYYPIDIKNPDGTYSLFEIREGATINMSFSFSRLGHNNCGKRNYNVDLEFISDGDYDSLKDWWDNNGTYDVEVMLNSGVQDLDPNEPPFKNEYDPILESGSPTVFNSPRDTNTFQFVEGSLNLYDPSDVRTYLRITGPYNCGGIFNQEAKSASLSAKIQISNIDKDFSVMVFETIPSEALPDVWYEDSETYAISGGYHVGNVQSQGASQAGVVDLAFFNCFTFGNGAESSKVLDSIVGKKLEIGNRASSTQQKDYREVRRSSDITYSGVYNDESNLNKFNEFNGGLLNFKPLDDIFGPIRKLDGRKDDILVLQEDKIGYVQYGVNLLSDAAGSDGVAIITPKVLGQHITRPEEYGISFHPESFAKRGAYKFFTDAKRGAVISLTGTSAGNEQLDVISNMDMRPWFRDMFKTDLKTQKIGGYDPYMDEYVLSGNDTLLPAAADIGECGANERISVLQGNPTVFYVDVGSLVGQSTVSYDIHTLSATSVEIEVEYGSTPTTTSSGAISTTGSGSFTFLKQEVLEDIAKVTVTVTGSEGTQVDMDISVGCVEPSYINIIQVCINNPNVAGETVYNSLNWSDGPFQSYPIASLVTLQSGSTPVVSQFNTIGPVPQGGSSAPSNTSDVKVSSYKLTGTFNFDDSVHRLLYLRSSTLYNNALSGLNNVFDLLSAATNLSINNPVIGLYEGTFNMPDTSDEYLYLIYDYRSSTEIDLCYEPIGELPEADIVENSCCNCV